MSQNMEFRCRVLVVEDDAVTSRILEIIVTDMDFVCEHVVDGVEALAALQQRPYQIMLLDINMPRMNGITLVQEMQQLLSESERPYVITVTAGIAVNSLTTAQKYGMDAYMPKPIVRKVLRQLLKQGCLIKTQKAAHFNN